MANHRALFKLLGTKSNRLAIGARVTVRTGSLTQFSEVKGGSSYLSQNDLRQHFGLGNNNNMDEVTVRWPSGGSEVLKNVPADFIYTVVEGKGLQPSSHLPGEVIENPHECVPVTGIASPTAKSLNLWEV